MLDYCNGPGRGGTNLKDMPDGQHAHKLQRLIAKTPAVTLAGVAAQLALAMELQGPCPDRDAKSQDLLALRNMRGTLRQLAGTGEAA